MSKIRFLSLSLIFTILPLSLSWGYILDHVVKVKSLGPVDQPELYSSGFAFGYEDNQYVVTTYHGVYTSAVSSEFVIYYNKDESTPCVLVSAEYKYDLALLRCDKPLYNFPIMQLTNNEATIGYFSINSHSVHVDIFGAVLAGYSANSYQLTSESGRQVKSLQPKPPWVPGLTTQYFVDTNLAAPGWSGGLLFVDRDGQRRMLGLISKISPTEVSGYLAPYDFYDKNIVSVIPSSIVSYFLHSAFEYGFSIEKGNSDIHPIPQQNGNPLQTIRVEDFIYSEHSIEFANEPFKVFSVRVVGDPDLAIKYTPYSGHNTFRGYFSRDKDCVLLLLGKAKYISDGYKITGEHYSQIDSVNEFVYHVITPSHEYVNYYYKQLVGRAHCPSTLKALEEIISVASSYVDQLQTQHDSFRSEAVNYLESIKKLYIVPNSSGEEELYKNLISTFVKSNIFNATQSIQPFDQMIKHGAPRPIIVPSVCVAQGNPVYENNCDVVWNVFYELKEVNRYLEYIWFKI